MAEFALLTTCVQIYVLFVNVFHFAYGENDVIETQLGNITGNIHDVTLFYENGTFYVTKYAEYLGIPYAEPPVGDRRFRRPEPKTAWTGQTHNGTYARPSCFYRAGNNSGSLDVVDDSMSEDCLTLDIYRPHNTDGTSGLLPVIIFIHSTPGSARGFVADVLCAEANAFVVVINYRQGLLGYFSLSENDDGTNVGLWDQHMAISWVKDHIGNFGGDTSRITVVGQSEGASHAIMQAMYPPNKPHIKRVISLSGTPIPTEGGRPFVRGSTSAEFAEASGCKFDQPKDVYTCLREKSLNELSRTISAPGYSFKFGPRVDGVFIKADPQDVLSASARSRFENEQKAFADVDLLLGMNDMEGGMHVALLWASLLNKAVDTFNVNVSEFESVVVPTSLELIFGTKVDMSVANTVSFQYSAIKGAQTLADIRQSVVDLSTDIDVAAPLSRTATLHANFQQGKTYMFQFSEPLNMNNPLTPTWLSGANRLDDIYFLFGFSTRALSRLRYAQGFQPTSEQRVVAKRFIKAIANFVANG